MNEKINHWYLHVDLDAFFASVEQLDHPEYRGKPVIVGGKPEERRGVVSTASYEARKFGVHSAMPTITAYKLCPQGIFVHGRMERYQELSFHIMNIFRQYSPDVDQMSIDEAFIDLTGTENLFGKPEDTAMKIKAQVKAETGLTVSIGLAQTKYIAKIASGYSKPDGFYFVKPGTETDFMLNLPLNKVWGIGNKTLEALNKLGIKSTKNLYDANLQLLKFHFGEKSACFMYNSVRGIESDTFSRIRKSHSISAERTFGYDIFDTYTAETYLLELCQHVSFRLLKENSFSKTVTLKIRYDDFSTVNIQQTYDSSILTSDSFFEAIRKLFEKKYEKGRGIRLLGVGFDNVEKENIQQFDLFENTDEKKQLIEKAILNLESKHPEIKIHKARLLDKTIKAILVCISLTFFCNTKLEAQQNTNQTEIQDNNSNTPELLFNWNFENQNNLDFLVSGYWLMSLEYSGATSFGNGKGIIFSSNVPIFKQEIDIYTWLLFNKKLYLEADFADEFKKNTIAIGYNGNSTLASARLSNRKIMMPTTYSASTFGYGLGGGNNQAFGLSMHFQDSINHKWESDFLIRYDMTKSCSATFYGSNKVEQEYIALSDYARGRLFVLPEESKESLKNLKALFVQSENGEYEDDFKRKYKKLSDSQYATFYNEGKILISDNANGGLQEGKLPVILAIFSDDDTVTNIISSTGDYSNPETFAGKIQSFFNTNKTINLQNYSYDLSINLSSTNNINERETALILQNSYGFSPFLVANTYLIEENQDSDFYVVSKNSDSINGDFHVSFSSDISEPTEDFINNNKNYINLENNNFNAYDLQFPANRYPAGDLSPEIYLNLKVDSDLSILIRSYTKISEYNIGKEAAENSVCVFINGVQDSLAKYDSETGIVSFSRKINDSDKIYITWEEESNDFSSGSISTGLGFIYKFSPDFSVDSALTIKWPVSIYAKYATLEDPLQSFAAFTSGMDFAKDFNDFKFNIKDKIAFSFVSDNPTGVLMITNPKDVSQESYYHSQNAGYITKTTPAINMSTSSFYLDSEKNGTIKNHKGITDSYITGYKIPLSFDFNSLDNSFTDSENISELNWASVDIKLNETSEIKSAAEIEFGILPDFDTDVTNEDFSVFLQLGISASEDFYGEDYNSVPTWFINGDSNLSDNVITSLDISKNEWQTITITVNDEDRSKLFTNQDARLIVVQKNSEIQNGKVFMGPYEPHKQGISVNSSDLVETKSDYVLSTSPSTTEYFSLKNYDNSITWNIENSQLLTDASDSLMTFTDFFKEVDFTSYETINFDFLINAISTEELISLDTDYQFTLILDDSNDAINDSFSKSLELNLMTILEYADEKYHTLTINLNEKTVFIDDNKIADSEYSLILNKNQKSERIKVKLLPYSSQNNQLIVNGKIYLGNLYLKNSKPDFNIINNFSTDFSKPGKILQINKYTIAENANLSLSSDQLLVLSKNQVETSSSKEVTLNANGEITVTNITYKANIDTLFNHSNKDILQQAAHSIQTSTPVFKVINFSENYNFFQSQELLNKNNSLELDFHSLKVPLSLSGNFTGTQNGNLQQQNGKINSSFFIQSPNYEGKISGNIIINQKINSHSVDNDLISFDNYFNDWYKISILQFSTGTANSNLRNIDYNFSFNNNFKKIKFSPVLDYELKSQNQKRNYNFTDTTKLSVKLPITIKNQSFYLNMNKTAIGVQNLETNSYISDSQSLFNLFDNRSWFYKAIPFYELFDKKLGETLLYSSTTNLSQYELYSTKYEAGWKRKINNNISDLFIPSSASFTINRELKATDNVSDLYQLKTVITDTALNMFGKTGLMPIFNWYNQDEILTSLTGTVKIPTDTLENISYNINLYNQLLLYINSKSTIKNILEFNFATDLNWYLRNSIYWNRDSKTSLLYYMVQIFVKNLDSEDYNFLRKDSFSIDIGEKKNILKQKYEYTHSVEMNIKTFYTITSSISTGYTHVENSGNTMNLTLSLGGKMEF